MVWNVPDATIVERELFGGNLHEGFIVVSALGVFHEPLFKLFASTKG